MTDDKLLKIAPIIQERIASLDDAIAMAGFFFVEDVHPSPETLVGKKMTSATSAEAVRRSVEIIEPLPEITHKTAEQPLRDLANDLGIKAGQLFGILRSAVTGQTVSPPLFESMAIIGKEKVLERLHKAIKVLEGMQA